MLFDAQGTIIMNKWIKKGLISLIFSILLVPLTMANQPTLRIATMEFNPPFETLGNDSSFLFGFDISVMDLVCNQIPMKCIYKPMKFVDVFKSLENNEADVAIADIIISEERKAYIFSIPYAKSKAQFLTQKDQPFNQISDLLNQKIGILNGSVFPKIIREKLGQQISITFFNNDSELVDALLKNQVQAILMDEPISLYWLANFPNDLKLIGDSFPVGKGLGIMTLPKNKHIIHIINKALYKLKKDGSIKALDKAYFYL